MATSENTIIDNFKISRGAQGERGTKGDTGPQGEKGVTGAAGPTGPSGENKLDINLQHGENPFATIASDYNDNNWGVLAYTIFPGTTIFSPEYIKIAYSLRAPLGVANGYFRLVAIDPNGTRTIVSNLKITETRTELHNYKIGTSTLTGLSTTETVLALEASKDVRESEFRAYALEIR
jgi:hypothetical protein